MALQVMGQSRLVCAIHMVEVFRFKEGPDHIYLHTNLPHPEGRGTINLYYPVPRYLGPDWVNANYKESEIHVYDYESDLRRANGGNPRRPEDYLNGPEAFLLAVQSE